MRRTPTDPTAFDAAVAGLAQLVEDHRVAEEEAAKAAQAREDELLDTLVVCRDQDPPVPWKIIATLLGSAETATSQKWARRVDQRRRERDARKPARPRRSH